MYEIIIKSIEDKDVTTHHYQRTADTGNEADKGPIYAYVPKTERTRVETEVFRQKVEALDLAAVVAVVNQIKVAA